MMGNKGMPGGFLSVSANGPDDGILWAAIPYKDDAWVEIVRGTLRAFDANTLQLLWSTDVNEPADNFDFAKYSAAHRRQRQGVSPHLFRSPERVRTARSQRRPHTAARADSLEETRAIAAMSKAPRAIRGTNRWRVLRNAGLPKSFDIPGIPVSDGDAEVKYPDRRVAMRGVSPPVARKGTHPTLEIVINSLEGNVRIRQRGRVIQYILSGERHPPFVGKA